MVFFWDWEDARNKREQLFCVFLTSEMYVQVLWTLLINESTRITTAVLKKNDNIFTRKRTNHKLEIGIESHRHSMIREFHHPKNRNNFDR